MKLTTTQRSPNSRQKSTTSLTQSLRERIVSEINASDLHYDCLADGPATAEVVIIGEGPGEREAQDGMPFVGGAGRLLFDALRKHNLGRHNVYTTNVVKRQISLSRKGNEKHVVHRDELQKWFGILRWELAQLPNARILFLLGNYALEAITGVVGILNERGSVRDITLDGRNYRVVTSINPAYAMRELKMEPMFLMDCQRLAQVVKGTFKKHEIEALINPSYKEARSFMRGLRKASKPIALDIETMSQETACIGLANDAHVAMCINWRDAKTNRYTTQEEADLLLDIQALCDTHQIIAQNAQFDAYFLRLRDWLCVKPWFDTLLAHHTLYPQLPHSLAFLCSQYTTHPYYKDEGKTWKEGGNIDQFWRYNATDVAITYKVYERELEELRKQGLEKFFFDHVMRATSHLISATVHGLRVDTSLRSEIVAQCQEEVEERKAEFYKIVHELTGDSEYFPNPLSWQQLRTLFFDKLKLEGRGQSTDDTNRKRILANPTTPPRAKDMLVTLGKFIEENKFVSTFAQSKEGRDGRFRCEYRQYGVSRAPGRLSSAQLLTGEGANLQNQPMRARSMFVADPDCVFIYFDLSQAEARVVAWRANIPKWKEQFEKARIDGKYDCHRALAAEMFNVVYDQVPKIDFVDHKGRSPKDPQCDHSRLQPTIRYKAKRCYTTKAEGLTKEGWLPLQEIKRRNLEMVVWKPDGSMHWELPSDWLEEEYNGDVVHFKGAHVDLTVTPDHRMPVYNNGVLTERLAGDNVSYGTMPIAGILKGDIHEPEYARLWAATWSDGSIEKKYPNSIRVSVKKERKANRLRELVKAIPSLRLWESFSGTMWHFRIYGFCRKALNNTVLQWNESTRRAFLDEVTFWDGNANRVFNTKLEDMQLIQTLAHITGMGANIVKHGNPKTNEKQCWTMRLFTKKGGKGEPPTTAYQAMTITHAQYKGKIICPTVSTGMLIVREGGHTIIGCNCRHGLNYRMMADRLAEVTGLPFQEARSCFNKYHQITPELKKWWQRAVDDFKATRVCYNAFGRRLKVIQRIDDEVLDSIIAFYPQSTIGDKVTRVWYQAEEDDKWPLHARVALNVHDSDVAMCVAKANDIKRCAQILKKYAEEPIQIQDAWGRRAEPLIVPAEFKISYPTSYDAQTGKFVDDPNGLHRWSHLKDLEV